MLLFVLTAGEVWAQGVQLPALRVRFDQASTAFRQGDVRTAHEGFKAVADALEPGFAAGEFKPNSGDPAWVLYGSSVLMLSDIHRYRSNEPRRAREIEAKLAAEAARLGYVDLAAAEWLAVGDIERFDLGDAAAALQSYQRVLDLSGGGNTVDGSLVNQALQGIAQTKGGRPAAIRELRLDIPLTQQHIEAVSLVLPHRPVYAEPSDADGFAIFAKEHPRSYRAAFSRYAEFLLAIVFRFDGSPSPDKGHDAFLETYPDDVLSVTVCEMMLAHYQRENRSAPAAEERARLAERKRHFGLAPGPAPVTTPGKGTPSAFEREHRWPANPAAPGSRQEVC